MRLEAARRALEETTVPIKCIALDCGFRDEERMRRAFVRCLGVSPLDYRARFSA
jgi:transcriptional regulator GlxA family with amidase domain